MPVVGWAFWKSNLIVSNSLNKFSFLLLYFLKPFCWLLNFLLYFAQLLWWSGSAFSRSLRRQDVRLRGPKLPTKSSGLLVLCRLITFCNFSVWRLNNKTDARVSKNGAEIRWDLVWSILSLINFYNGSISNWDFFDVRLLISLPISLMLINSSWSSNSLRILN